MKCVVLLVAAVCLASCGVQGNRAPLGWGGQGGTHSDCGAWVWRFQQAYKVNSPTAVDTLASALNHFSTSAPANATPMAWYFGTTDISNGLPGSFDKTKNRPEIYTTADVAGYQDFPTLNTLVAYLMWLGQQPSFLSLVPLLKTFAWTDYAFYKTGGDCAGIYRVQLQWKFPRFDGQQFTLANNTGISQAGLINITQFSPVKPLRYSVNDDGAFWIHMGGRLPPNYDIAGFWDFETQDDMNQFLKYLSTANDYEEGMQVINATINMAYRVTK